METKDRIVRVAGMIRKAGISDQFDKAFDRSFVTTKSFSDFEFARAMEKLLRSFKEKERKEALDMMDKILVHRLSGDLAIPETERKKFAEAFRIFRKQKGV